MMVSGLSMLISVLLIDTIPPNNESLISKYEMGPSFLLAMISVAIILMQYIIETFLSII